MLSVIQRFSSRGENADDLFQVGCVGLIKAIDNFDINQPVRFSTYGVPMIIGEIRRYLPGQQRHPGIRSMRDTAYRVLQVRDRLLAENQREPSVEQIAKELDLPREGRWCSPWMPSWTRYLCTNRCIPTVGTPSASWTRSGTRKNTDEDWTDRIALKEALKRLDPRERRILSLPILRGQDPDGGLCRGGNLPGPGFPFGKGRHQHH